MTRAPGIDPDAEAEAETEAEPAAEAGAPEAAAGTAARPSPGPATRSILDERYGRTRARGIDRRLGWGLAAALLLAGLAVLLFSGWQTRSTVEFRDLHYRVIDDRTVSVEFEVTSPPGDAVACAIEALSPSYATVGWKVVELPTAEQRTRRFSEELVTTHRATTGTIRSCWVVDRSA